MYEEMSLRSKNDDMPYRNKDFIKAADKVKDKYFQVKATTKPKE